MKLKLLPIHRVSTAMQAGEQGEGLDRQREATRRIALAHDAILLDPVEITDVSGSDVDQTQEWRCRVLPAIADSAVHVVADSIDRILRAEAFNFRVFQDLYGSGTHIYTPGKVHNLSNPEDGFMAALTALMGGREKAEIKRRIMAGREAARRRGEWPLRNSALARGITYNRKTKTWGYDEPEADVIRRVFQAVVVERRAICAVAREIGKPMQTVEVYLRNSIYKGLLRYEKKRGEKYPTKNGKQGDRRKIRRAPEEVIEVRVFGGDGQLPQLVLDETWAAAQQILLGNSALSARRRDEGRPEAWASGFLVSALAPLGTPRPDGFLDLSLADSVNHVIYLNGGAVGERRYSCRCGRREARLVRCALRSPMAHRLHVTLDAYLEAVTREDWFLGAVRESLMNREDVTDSRRSTVERRLRDMDAREGRLTRLYLGGRIEPDLHDAEQDKLRAEREVLRVELASLAARTALPTEGDLDKLAKVWAWDAGWEHTRKRAWLGKYVHEIAMSNDGIEWAVIRIPAGAGVAPVFSTHHAMKWIVPLMTREPPSPKGTRRPRKKKRKRV